MRHIAINAGAEGSIVVSKVKEMNGDEGFNAATEVYEDLVKAGVIDPAKVVRSALQNASSIASLLLTTEALISEIPEGKAGAEPAAGRSRRRHGCDGPRDQISRHRGSGRPETPPLTSPKTRRAEWLARSFEVTRARCLR